MKINNLWGVRCQTVGWGKTMIITSSKNWSRLIALRFCRRQKRGLEMGESAPWRSTGKKGLSVQNCIAEIFKQIASKIILLMGSSYDDTLRSRQLKHKLLGFFLNLHLFSISIQSFFFSFLVRKGIRDIKRQLQAFFLNVLCCSEFCSHIYIFSLQLCWTYFPIFNSHQGQVFID